MTAPDTAAPIDTAAAAPVVDVAPAPARTVGEVVAIDSYDSYAGRDVTDLFLVVQATDHPDEGPRVVLAYLGNTRTMAHFPAAAVRSL